MKPTPRDLIRAGEALWRQIPTMAKGRGVHPLPAPPTEILLSGPVTPVEGGHHRMEYAQGIPNAKASARFSPQEEVVAV